MLMLSFMRHIVLLRSFKRGFQEYYLLFKTSSIAQPWLRLLYLSGSSEFDLISHLSIFQEYAPSFRHTMRLTIKDRTRSPAAQV